MMDAMNVDWCLTCSKQTSHGKSYCSRSCKLRANEYTETYAGEFNYISDDASSSSDALRDSSSPLHQPHQHLQPSSSSHRAMSRRTSNIAHSRSTHYNHHSRRHANPQQQQFLEAEITALSQWPGYNEAGIDAWRSAIPPGSAAAVDGLSIGPGMSYSYARPQFPLSRQRPAGPALCTDTTQPARTSIRSSSPIALPSPRAGASTSDVNGEPSFSFSSHSLASALAESVTLKSSTTHGRTTKTQVRAENNGNANGRPGVLEGIARRFRAWGTSSETPARLKPYAPAKIFMETTTTTVPASPSPSLSPSSIAPSPAMQRSNTVKSVPRSSTSGFTARPTSRGDENDNASDEEVEEEEQAVSQQQKIRKQVFDLRVPLANARSPLAIRDFELKRTIKLPSDDFSDLERRMTRGKRGVWIAGREKEVIGWAGFGPAHYERGFKDHGPARRRDLGADREMGEFEAWNARGRKATRALVL